MEGAKIKNFIIIVLILLNAFLLILVIMDKTESSGSRRAVYDDLSRIFEDNGISLSGVREAMEEPTPYYVLQRDLERERESVLGLLGGGETQDLGGGVYLYRGADGEATFRAAGEFEIRLDAGAYAFTDDDIEAEALSICKKLGIETAPGFTEREDGEDGGMTVVLVCAYDGAAVYNGEIYFRFAEDALLISGRRPLDLAEVIESGETLDVVTLMIRFLNTVRDGGKICTQVQGMDLGYMIETTVSGIAELRPVWKLATDAGDYYLGAVTGKVEAVV